MKSRIKISEQGKEFMETVKVQANRAQDRGALMATVGMCLALSEIGICDNTIKKAVSKMQASIDKTANEMLQNLVSYKDSNHQTVDVDTNRESLHLICQQWGFDFRDEILIRQVFNIRGEKFTV